MRIEHAIRVMGSEEQRKATALRNTVAGLGALEGETATLSELLETMQIFQAIEQSNGSAPPGYAQLQADVTAAAMLLLSEAESISQTVVAARTAGAYLRTPCPELATSKGTEHRAETANACWPLVAAFHHLYMLAVGELVTLCEAAEKAHGIRPIRLVA